MKKQFILASLMAFSAAATAQWSTSGSSIYNTTIPRNVGINTATPSFALDVCPTLMTMGSGFPQTMQQAILESI
jgi:hypothetical protein